MDDKISVIVPIYNVEKYILQCLDSIVNQTYSNLEIILVDDGSPDDCGMICDEYADRDNRIMVVHQDNRGVSVARNIGMDMANGEWIMFVDPDDWLELDCCEKVLGIAQEKKLDIVYFQSQEVDETGKTVRIPSSIGSFQFASDALKKLQLDILAGNITTFGFVSSAPWGKMFRRSLLIQHQCRYPVGLTRSQDIIFNLYCLEYIQQAYYLDYVGYNYRLNLQSTCHRRNMQMMNIMFQVLRESENFVWSYHKNEEEYMRRLGAKTIAIQKEMRGAMFFHPTGYMSYSEYCEYMTQYYDNDIVKRYIGKCSLSDFKTIKNKMQYFLIAGHHVFLYYVIALFISESKKIYWINKKPKER